jgi:hypothetical protein
MRTHQVGEDEDKDRFNVQAFKTYATVKLR